MWPDPAPSQFQRLRQPRPNTPPRVSRADEHVSACRAGHRVQQPGLRVGRLLIQHVQDQHGIRLGHHAFDGQVLRPPLERQGNAGFQQQGRELAAASAKIGDLSETLVGSARQQSGGERITAQLAGHVMDRKPAAAAITGGDARQHRRLGHRMATHFDAGGYYSAAAIGACDSRRGLIQCSADKP